MENQKGNEVLEFEEITDEKIKNDQISKNSHSVLDYLKEHPAIFATMMSAIIAVIAFVLNTTLYHQLSRYLQYWGFSANDVLVSNNSQRYILIVALVYFVAMTYIQMFLIDTYSIYQEYGKASYCLKQISKKVLKRCRKLKRRICAQKLKLKWIQVFKKTDSELIQLIAQGIEKQNKELCDIVQDERMNQKTLRVLHYCYFKALLPSLIVASVITCVFVLVFGAISMVNGKTLIFGSIFTTIIMVFFPYIVLHLKNSKSFKKKVKKAIQTDDQKIGEIWRDALEKGSKDYPIRNILIPDMSKIFSNKNIAQMVALMIMAMLYIFFMFSYNIGSTTTNQQQFSITRIDEVEYAIIYKNSNTYYLDEAQIDGENIIVDTTKHRVLVTNDMTYEVLEYNSVSRVTNEERN